MLFFELQSLSNKNIAWESLQDAFNNTQKAQFNFIPNFEHLKTNFNNNVKGRRTINYNGCN